MKVLVLGSKGFIGSHVLSYFRSLQAESYGCDVVVEYNDPHYFQVEATNSSYEDVFLSHKFDACINCSGAASVPDSFVHPFRDFSLNVHNLFALLEAVRKHNPLCKVLNVSSAAVYGTPLINPVSEISAAKPVSPYGLHKLYSEMITEEFARYFHLRTCSVRVFSAYGPGLRKQLFWDWARKVKEHNHIDVLGTGDESRDFIYIDDLVVALKCVLDGSVFQGEVINVANGIEVTIRDAIQLYQRLSVQKFSFAFSNAGRVGDPVNWKADISKLNALGYEQKISFEHGLGNYLKWATENA